MLNPSDGSGLGVFQPGTLNPEPLNLGFRYVIANLSLEFRDILIG
jgi:hypothetical protein